MDSLTIQDVFEPYYAGRKRFPAPRDGNRSAEADASRPKKPLLPHPQADAGLSTEPDSMTEH
jgi:hypothetical protein